MSSGNFKLSGLNALSYLGVQSTTPPQLLYVQRAPTANDFINILPGTLWLYVGQPDNTPIQLYMAATVIPRQATWILLYPASSGGAEEFVTDSGTAVPSGGIINVKGGSNINTQATFPNNIIINLDSTVALSGSLSVADNVTFTGIGAGVLQASILGVVTGSRGTNGQVLIGDTGLPPVWNNITSTDGSITITNGPGTINLGVTNGPSGIIITTFDISGTWTPNANTAYAVIYMVSGGNGGGSGKRGLLNNAAGGGGGAPGAAGTFNMFVPFLAEPATITIGAGGTGGAAITTDNTVGNSGNPGGSTFVGKYYNAASFNSGAVGGGGGAYPAVQGASNFTIGAPGYSSFNNTVSPGQRWFAGAGLATLIEDGTGDQANDGYISGTVSNPFNFNSVFAYAMMWNPGLINMNFGTLDYFANGYAGSPVGGGGGSGPTTVPFRGGYGGTYGFGSISTGTIDVVYAAGGIQGGTINGENGLSYLAATSDAGGQGGITWGTGGGGGGGNTAGVGGTGGNGGQGGGGGGGGGGSLNGNNSGAGGSGGNGLVIIFEFL